MKVNPGSGRIWNLLATFEMAALWNRWPSLAAEHLEHA